MEKTTIIRLTKNIEEYAYEEQGLEFWFARDLQRLLDYEEWRNFSKVIEKAKEACKQSGQNVSDHFVGVNKTIPMPKGASKEVTDFMLTRYACYLIAQKLVNNQDKISIKIRNKEIIKTILLTSQSSPSSFSTSYSPLQPKQKEIHHQPAIFH